LLSVAGDAANSTNRDQSPVLQCILTSFKARQQFTVIISYTEWANGLRGKNPQVEQITRNILDLLSG